MLVCAAVLWSTGGIFIKMIDLHPMSIAGWRSLIAAITLLLLVGKPKITWSLPQMGGGIAYVGTVILFVISNKLTTAANAIILQYTAPIYVALLGIIILKEKVGLRGWLTMALALCGVAMFFGDKIDAGGQLGNILSVVSGLSLAFLIIALRYQKSGSPAETILVGNVITALVCLPFMGAQIPNARMAIPLVLLGTLQLGLAYYLYANAIKYVPALEAIIIPIIEPILNPLWVFIFMGERPGAWSLAGGGVVLVSVTAYCILTRVNGSPALRDDTAPTG
ncbi:MAG: EamA family transporter [Spirochaetes bacterium]|nr:MAG: EamA family transporter [Spirochaetota bacterium]